MITLAEALNAARLYWNTRRGSKVMESRAAICVTILGGHRVLTTLTTQDGLKLLVELSKRGLSRKSQGDYYSTLRRVLALSGVQTITWPRAPEPERRTRQAFLSSDVPRITQRLLEAGYPDTADLASLLFATGGRVGVELLAHGNLQECGRGAGFIMVRITGKGGHERDIPVLEGSAFDVLQDPRRLDRMRRTPYSTHLDRWRKACKALDIKTKLASPHSMRHNYATRVLEQSGGNLRLVQELLGHANPGTTARYAEVSTASKVNALKLG